MALPADFSKIFGSTATGGLTPIGDVNYAKGWEFVGSNPPTKNDFSYLQNLSDLKSQWLYSNKLQRANPFGDIKSDGAVHTALENLGLGDGSALPVGVPVPWPSATPPTGWLKCNGAPFAAENYPKLAMVYPGLVLPDLRGEFIRGWDDGRGIDAGRALLSEQTPKVGQFWARATTYKAASGGSVITDAMSIGESPASVQLNNENGPAESYIEITPSDTRPLNVAFNYIVRAM